MSRFGNQMFTFTWRIENFSMCPQQFKQHFESPEFVVDFLENTKWKLRIHPRGVQVQNSLCVSLVRDQECKHPPEIDILWSLVAPSTYDEKNIERGIQNDTFPPGRTVGYIEFCARDEIFKLESGLLPNDTLTLRCQLSGCAKEQETNDVLEELKTDCWNCNPVSKKYECSARTRIKVSTTSFVWSIKGVCELSGDVKLSTSVPCVMKSEPSLDFSLYLKKDAEEGKSTRIQLRRKNPNEGSFFVRCLIKTVGAPRNVQFEGRDEHYFKGQEQDVWIFPTFFKMNDLTESYFKHTDGALYLQIDLSFSNVNDVLDTESVCQILPHDFVTERQKPLVSTSNLPKLYTDREFVDAALRVEEKEFKVHKLILISQSDVFRRMFESGMKEEQNGVVDIADLDADTVERLLKYMYSHELEKMNPEDAIKLYSAADKYNMADLKCRLRSVLVASLTVNTVCETLVLADLHHDVDLLESVFDYVFQNNVEIFHSQNWKDFVKTHAELAASTMLRFLMK